MTEFQRIIKLAGLSLVLIVSACDSNLNTLDGPKSGKVSGLMCTDLETMLAAREHDVVRTAMLDKGKCRDERNAMQVTVESTVMMPTDGKYSKIIWPKDGKAYWVRTEAIK